MSQDMNRIIEIKKVLQKNAEEIEEWYDDCIKKDTNQESFRKAIETLDRIDELCKFCTIINKSTIMEEIGDNQSGDGEEGDEKQEK